jgi:hypothetical protein
VPVPQQNQPKSLGGIRLEYIGKSPFTDLNYSVPEGGFTTWYDPTSLYSVSNTSLAEMGANTEINEYGPYLDSNAPHSMNEFSGLSTPGTYFQQSDGTWIDRFRIGLFDEILIDADEGPTYKHLPFTDQSTLWWYPNTTDRILLNQYGNFIVSNTIGEDMADWDWLGDPPWPNPYYRVPVGGYYTFLFKMWYKSGWSTNPYDPDQIIVQSSYPTPYGTYFSYDIGQLSNTAGGYYSKSVNLGPLYLYANTEVHFFYKRVSGNIRLTDDGAGGPGTGGAGEINYPTTIELLSSPIIPT